MQVVFLYHFDFLVACTRLYKSLRPSVGRSVAVYKNEPNCHNKAILALYCPCPTARDWAYAVYTALFSPRDGIAHWVTQQTVTENRGKKSANPASGTGVYIECDGALFPTKGSAETERAHVQTGGPPRPDFFLC